MLPFSVPLSAPSSARRAFSTAQAVSLTLQVALEHHAAGRLREAAELYREVRTLDPGNADVLFLLGLIALTTGHLSAAERLLGQASQRLPRAAYVHRALAELFMRRGRPAAALACCWQALAIEPNHAPTYADLARALQAIKPSGGNDALAAECRRRAQRAAAQRQQPKKVPVKTACFWVAGGCRPA